MSTNTTLSTAEVEAMEPEILELGFERRRITKYADRGLNPEYGYQCSLPDKRVSLIFDTDSDMAEDPRIYLMIFALDGRDYYEYPLTLAGVTDMTQQFNEERDEDSQE